MSTFLKTSPYLLALIGALIGAVKWLYGTLQKERDRYSDQADHKEKVIVEKDKIIADKDLQIADLKAKVREQKWLIDQYVKRMPADQKEDKTDET